MAEYIDVFHPMSDEYRKLEAVANLMTAFSPSRSLYKVGVTYFDLGQGWKWTTILCTYECEWSQSGYSTYQALNPREQERICEAESITELAEIAQDILESSLLDKAEKQ